MLHHHTTIVIDGPALDDAEVRIDHSTPGRSGVGVSIWIEDDRLSGLVIRSARSATPEELALSLEEGLAGRCRQVAADEAQAAAEVAQPDGGAE